MFLLCFTPKNRRATKILQKKGAWRLKLFSFKNASIGWRAEQSSTTESFHIDWGLGAKPQSLGDFLFFREKITLSKPFGSHFASIYRIGKN